MTFRLTRNVESNRCYYYLDGKRVSNEKFYFHEALCRQKGMIFNCLFSTKKRNLDTVHFSYN